MHSVVLLTNCLGDGGGQLQLMRIAAGLRERGWNTTVLSVVSPGEAAAQLTARGVPVETLHLSRNGSPGPGVLPKAVRMLRRLRPEAVVSFLYQSNLLGRVAGRLAGVPVVISALRNETMGSRARDGLLRLTAPLDTATVANSHAVGESMVARRLVEPSRLRVVGNAVDTEASGGVEPADRCRMRAELGVAEDDFLWLAAGRLEPQKDYATLLDAAARLCARGWQLRIAGRGSLYEELVGRAAQSGLNGRVTFLGLREDVPALLAAADGLVLSSAWEGLPNIIMEALAAGTPVVATRVGGVLELVDDGRSGFTVPPRQPAELAAAMDRLMALPAEERRRMGERGHAETVRRYAAPRVFDAWERLLRELIARREG